MTLRRIPDDFRVEEQLRDDIARGLTQPRGGKGGRAYAVYQLTKSSLTTEGAVARLARALGLSPGQISYAGLKDKHARTSQHMSAGPLERTTRAPETASGDGWSARLLGWSKDPAAAAWIRRNRFAITVRALTPGRVAQMDAAAAFLTASPTTSDDQRRLLLVNYFGDQRFGSARHGGGFVARHLVRGEFEQALRLAIGTPARKDAGKRRTLTRRLFVSWGQWNKALTGIPACPERKAIETLATGGDFRAAFAALPYFFQQMCVEAYQSHLWNEMARRMALSMAPADAAPGGGGRGGGASMVVESPFGAQVLPAPACAGVTQRALELPMLAPTTRLVDPWRTVAESVLKDEGIALEELQIPGMRRRLKRTVTFELPRGAYATVLLRALGA
jgi:tRNA pseudouridine13 synthase